MRVFVLRYSMAMMVMLSVGGLDERKLSKYARSSWNPNIRKMLSRIRKMTGKM